SNLDPDMLNKPFDPNNDYSIPYIWVKRLVEHVWIDKSKLTNFSNLDPDMLNKSLFGSNGLLSMSGSRLLKLTNFSNLDPD
ncbi:hypothetical protein PS021_24620, partial [Shigella sonnei]|nr:hypothetical protein [Shigella sonnei]